MACYYGCLIEDAVADTNARFIDYVKAIDPSFTSVPAPKVGDEGRVVVQQQNDPSARFFSMSSTPTPPSEVGDTDRVPPLLTTLDDPEVRAILGLDVPAGAFFPWRPVD